MRVEVLKYLALIWIGYSFRLLGHAEPGDSRPGPPIGRLKNRLLQRPNRFSFID